MSDIRPEEALERLLAAGVIKLGSRPEKLLSYLIHAEVSGNSDKINAYSIAQDVLGRGANFDPATDSIVRVEIGRLRNTLNAYYEGLGAGDPIRISIPKGQSRPLIKAVDVSKPTTFTIVDSEQDIAKDIDKGQRKLLGRWMILATLAVLSVSLAVVFFLRTDTIAPEEEARGPVAPIVEFRAFKSSISDPALAYLSDGIRSSLVREISHLSILQVRDNPENIVISDNLPSSDYLLNGELFENNGEIILAVNLTDVSNYTIVWAGQVMVPPDGESIKERLNESARQVTMAIGSPGGVVMNEITNRLSVHVAANVYTCHLRWYAWDLSKAPEMERLLRKCLKNLQAAQTNDGLIWSFSGFMDFLDWTKSGEGYDHPLMKAALKKTRNGVRLAPLASDAHEYLGSVLLAIGQVEEAADAYQVAVQLNHSKPDLKVLAGWVKALNGEWEDGIHLVNQGINDALVVPGWFRIPLALDAYRTGDFQTALKEAELMIVAGDQRGTILALIAAAELGDADALAEYFAVLGASNRSPESALAEIRGVFEDEDLFERLNASLAKILNN